MNGSRGRRRPTTDLVLAMVALFAAITGSAVALPGKNKVTSDDIAPGQVRTADLKRGAVGADQLLGKPIPRDAALRGRAVARQSGLEQSFTVSEPNSALFQPGSFSGVSLAANGIDDGDGGVIAGSAVGSEEVANGSVTTAAFNLEIPAAGATITSNKTIALGGSQTEPIDFDTVWSVNPPLMESGEGTMLCAPARALYRLNASVTWDDETLGSRILLLGRDQRNLAASSIEAGDGVTSQSVSAMARLNAGECIQVNVIQTAFDPGPPIMIPDVQITAASFQLTWLLGA